MSEDSRKTVLFAEDEKPVRDFVAALLASQNFHVITAVDGREALEKCKAHNGRIDLLLSNIQMPGITGIELATQVHLQRPETKILLISGLQTGMLVLDEGWQFLPKPFLPNMLREKIRSMLDGEQPQDIPSPG